MRQIGMPSICAAFRYWIHAGGIGGEMPRPLARGIERFQGWMQRHNINPDRDYVRFYEHYLLKLPPEHLELLDEEIPPDPEKLLQQATPRLPVAL